MLVSDDTQKITYTPEINSVDKAIEEAGEKITKQKDADEIRREKTAIELEAYREKTSDEIAGKHNDFLKGFLSFIVFAVIIAIIIKSCSANQNKDDIIEQTREDAVVVEENTPVADESNYDQIAALPASEIVGTSANMSGQTCENELLGQWLWDGNNNRWICHKKSERNDKPQTKVASENSINDTNNISLTKSAAEYNDQASNLMNKNPKKAIDLLNQAIKINPTEGWYYNNRAAAYMMLQNPKKAMQDYNKAISILKNDGVIYENRGYAYWQLGNLQKAKADAKKACSLGDCTLKKEIAKWERENARLAEEHAPAADAAPLDEEVQ